MLKSALKEVKEGLEDDFMKEFLSKMVKVKDIKKAIIDKIKTLNIKVYSDNIKEGFDTPCIFVSVKNMKIV